MISRLRVFCLLVVCAAGAGTFLRFPASSSAAQWIQIYTLQALGLLLLGIATDVDERRTDGDARAAPMFLLRPLVPGEGRGVAFVLLVLAISLASFLAARAVHAASEPLLGADDPVQLALIELFSLAYCLVPATAGRRWPPGAPRFVRLVGLTLAGLLVFMLFGMLVSMGLPAALRDTVGPLVFPPLLLKQVTRDGHITAAGWTPFLILCGVDAVLLAVHLPRVLRGLSGPRRP